MFYIQVAEGTRMIQLLIIVLAVPAKLYLRSLDLLEELHEQGNRAKDYLNVCTAYRRLTILATMSNKFIGPASFSMLRLSVYLSAFINFIVLKFYGIIPNGIYSVFIFGAVCIVLVIGMILPQGTRLYDHSSLALIHWKAKLQQRMTLIRKTYRSLRPLYFVQGFMGFNFSILEKSTKSEYYHDITDDTMDLCISVPDSMIEDLRMLNLKG